MFNYQAFGVQESLRSLLVIQQSEFGNLRPVLKLYILRHKVPERSIAAK